MDQKPLIRPRAGDIHFLAYISALAGSLLAVWLVQGLTVTGLIELFMMLLFSGFFLFIPFIFAAIGIWLTQRLIPEWYLRLPWAGSTLATVFSFIGTLAFCALL